MVPFKVNNLNGRRTKVSRNGQIGIGIIVVILAIIGAVLFVTSNVQEPSTPPIQEIQETLSSLGKPAGETSQDLVIPLQEGSEAKSLEEIVQTDDFYVEYQKPFDTYILVIAKAPVDEVRQRAEQTLLQKTGGDKAALCALSFRVVVPKQVTGTGSAESFNGLDICR